MSVGFSQAHSFLVPLILNVTTGKISPQYHVVFFDKFATVNSLPTEDSLDNQWACMFKLGRDFHLNLGYSNDGNIKTSDLPRLNDEWLNPNSQQGKRILIHPRADQTVTAPRRASDDDAILAPERAGFSHGLSKNTRSQAKYDEFEPLRFAATRI